MARGKKAQQAENRRAHLDNEVMQQLKEENRQLRDSLEKVKQEIHDQAVNHNRTILHEVEERTAETIAKAKESIELTEDAARAFVQARTEAIISATVATYNQVPNPVQESWDLYLNSMRESGIHDYDQFFHDLVKTIDTNAGWGRHHGRNLRKSKMVENRWQEELKIAHGFDPSVIQKMKKMAERREQEA